MYKELALMMLDLHFQLSSLRSHTCFNIFRILYILQPWMNRISLGTVKSCGVNHIIAQCGNVPAYRALERKWVLTKSGCGWSTRSAAATAGLRIVWDNPRGKVPRKQHVPTHDEYRWAFVQRLFVESGPGTCGYALQRIFRSPINMRVTFVFIAWHPL